MTTASPVRSAPSGSAAKTKERLAAASAPHRPRQVRSGAPTIPAEAFTAAMRRIAATIRETDEMTKEAMALIG